VGVVAQSLSRSLDTNPAQQLGGFFGSLTALHVPVQQQWLHDLVADSQHRVEGCHWLLKHHGDPASPNGAHFFSGQGKNIRTIQKYGAGADKTGRRHKAHDGEGGHGFTRARLSHQGQGGALVDGKADSVDSGDNAVMGFEAGMQVYDLEQGRHMNLIKGNATDSKISELLQHSNSGHGRQAIIPGNGNT